MIPYSFDSFQLLITINRPLIQQLTDPVLVPIALQKAVPFSVQRLAHLVRHIEKQQDQRQINSLHKAIEDALGLEQLELLFWILLHHHQTATTIIRLSILRP